MKSQKQLLSDVERRLSGTWHTDLLGETNSWPHYFPIGSPGKSELEANFPKEQREALSWADWSKENVVSLRCTSRRVHGTTQQIPTHIGVESIDDASTLIGDKWPQLLGAARNRTKELVTQFPNVQKLATVLRACEPLSDVDFDLLCTTALWFRENDATGLTARQVPITGIHAKWLDANLSLVKALASKETLGLRHRPSKVNFTYLDPEYLASGGRVHDSATVGDSATPQYPPEVVLISENKDTSIYFPPFRSAIAIEGAGFGGSTIASFCWITKALHLFYWGDMDAEGYEILNGFRNDGLKVKSILMDLETFDEYAKYGTTTDKAGRLLAPRSRKDLPHLTRSERQVYERVTDPNWGGVRRIEQERIQLVRTVEILNTLVEESAK